MKIFPLCSTSLYYNCQFELHLLWWNLTAHQSKITTPSFLFLQFKVLYENIFDQSVQWKKKVVWGKQQPTLNEKIHNFLILS